MKWGAMVLFTFGVGIEPQGLRHANTCSTSYALCLLSLSLPHGTNTVESDSTPSTPVIHSSSKTLKFCFSNCKS